MIYSKERFIKAMKKIEDSDRFVCSLEAAAKQDECSYIEWMPPDCRWELIEALEAMFDDNTGAIEWFCNEIDYGREYTEGDNLLNDEDFPLRNYNDLYDYLIASKEMENSDHE